eukprot:2842810-Pleurochrysis_carterae.AAC.1
MQPPLLDRWRGREVASLACADDPPGGRRPRGHNSPSPQESLVREILSNLQQIWHVALVHHCDDGPESGPSHRLFVTTMDQSLVHRIVTYTT